MKRIISLLLALLLVFAALPVWADDTALTVNTSAPLCFISKYGNVFLYTSIEEFNALGFQLGDVVTVSFLGKEIDMPYCSSYSDVDTGSNGLFARIGETHLILAINMGDFATTDGIATKEVFADKTYKWNPCEGVQEDLPLTITMKTPGGYYEEYVMHALSYTNKREDYADLTDEQYANFREVATTGMGKGRLYRTATPVDPERNRNTYADTAMRNAGVKAVVNLGDDLATVKAFEGFDQSYYATINTIELNLTMDFADATNQALLAEGLRFMAQNEGPYAIHCLEGKDRTGFVIALLECLMGASYDEVKADYMVTFYNYYGVAEDDVRYETIAKGNIEKSLKNVFGIADPAAEDLAACAKSYLKKIGMTDAEIAALQKNLAEPVAEPAPVAEPVVVIAPSPVVEPAPVIAPAPATEPTPTIAPAPATDSSYTVVRGDCLWNLAKKYYGSGTFYKKLAEANNIANPNLIFIGQQLVIPQ